MHTFYIIYVHTKTAYAKLDKSFVTVLDINPVIFYNKQQWTKQHRAKTAATQNLVTKLSMYT